MVAVYRLDAETGEARPECPGCGHGQHAAYACSAAALFIKGRCGCDSNYGDLPPKWRNA